MSTPVKVLLVGCGVLIVLGLGGCFVFVSYLLHEPEGMEVSVDAPGSVTSGERFALVARVGNAGDREVELVDLDVADAYLEGIAILGSDPVYRGSMHVPIDNTVSYSFDLEVPPGGDAVVTFDAEAVHVGDFSGDFDFCIDSEIHCLSFHVRTVVTASP